MLLPDRPFAERKKKRRGEGGENMRAREGEGMGKKAGTAMLDRLSHFWERKKAG